MKLLWNNFQSISNETINNQHKKLMNWLLKLWTNKKHSFTCCTNYDSVNQQKKSYKLKKNQTKVKQMKPTPTKNMKYLNGQRESYSLSARKKFIKKKLMYVKITCSNWLITWNATHPDSKKLNLISVDYKTSSHFNDWRKKEWTCCVRKNQFVIFFA